MVFDTKGFMKDWLKRVRKWRVADIVQQRRCEN